MGKLEDKSEVGHLRISSKVVVVWAIMNAFLIFASTSFDGERYQLGVIIVLISAMTIVAAYNAAMIDLKIETRYILGIMKIAISLILSVAAVISFVHNEILSVEPIEWFIVSIVFITFTSLCLVCIGSEAILCMACTLAVKSE